MEEYRCKTDKETANILANYAKKNGGPKIQGCFCKDFNVQRYITTFWNWFDLK